MVCSFIRSSWIGLLLFATAVDFGTCAAPPYNSDPFKAFGKNSSSKGLKVDLGYEQYQGVSNNQTGLNNWLGIRYAAPPIDQNRWQPPQVPETNRSEVFPAGNLPNRCPQTSYSPKPNGWDSSGTEDCLFLSVYAPPNKKDLPVLVWIHGGGYGQGQGNEDLSPIINANGDAFVGVAIQYRLGAFGFLSSDDVNQHGTPNAGLLDQFFAIQWVQDYIHLFGGDPGNVTISGESAGGGSVMLQTMAYGGTLGNSLFTNVISASPYLPMQFGFADDLPTSNYNAFAAAAGCNTTGSAFRCLQGKDSGVLIAASEAVSSAQQFGTWGFLPVTDGVFIKDLPSQQMLSKQLNGQRLLVGNNEDEGPGFVPQNITTEENFLDYLHYTFPRFSASEIQQLVAHYPSTNASVDPSTPKYSTNGTSFPTALNESVFGTGHQQRANNLYGETTFVCPSYWMAEAYSGSGEKKSYKYQYSVLPAEHGQDTSGYFGPPAPSQGPDFVKAFMMIWGNFVITGDPSVSDAVARGATAKGGEQGETNFSGQFPVFTLDHPTQLNLNQTGGTPYNQSSFAYGQPDIIAYGEPGLKNDFKLVDAFSWEGGRGNRCDFWRGVGTAVPE